MSSTSRLGLGAAAVVTLAVLVGGLALLVWSFTRPEYFVRSLGGGFTLHYVVEGRSVWLNGPQDGESAPSVLTTRMNWGTDARVDAVNRVAEGVYVIRTAGPNGKHTLVRAAVPSVKRFETRAAVETFLREQGQPLLVDPKAYVALEEFMRAPSPPV